MTNRSVAQRIFSFPATLAGAVLATLALLAANPGTGDQALADPDIWWHLANARYLVTTHHFLRQDMFSFTVPGTPWINIEWLAELPYYFAFQHIGYTGLYVVMMSVVAAILLGTFRLAWLRSRDVWASFLAAWLAALFATVSLGPRMLLFGWLMLVAQLLIAQLFKQGRDYTWTIPIVFMLWINFHGSWMIGFVLWIVWMGSGFIGGMWGSVEAVPWTPPQRRKLLLVTVASFVALFLNPYGWHMVAYPFDMAFKQADNLKQIAEWATIDFHGFRGKLVLGTLLGFAVINLLRRRQWPLSELLLALIAIYSAVTYSRFIFMAGIVLAPMLAVDLHEVMVFIVFVYRPETDRIPRNAVALALLAGVIYWAVPSKTVLHDGAVATFPEKALPHLAQVPASARIFNHYEWGGYMIWNQPQHPTFVDSRTDIFVHAGTFNEYALAATPFHSLEIFDKYRIDYVLMPHDTALGYLLANTPGWTLDYQDHNTALYRRTAGK